MQISEKHKQFNQNRVLYLINITKAKIEKQESIKNELFILREICNYLKQMHDDSIETITLLDEVIPEFSYYQEKYKEVRKEKRLQKIRLQKQYEYKKTWREKSLVYQIFHQKMNPKQIDFMQMTNEKIIEGIEKLKGKQK